MDKILVVEDDRDIQELLKNYFEDAGYHVDFANDGLDGYEQYKKGEYDLILLDIMMPKIDGYGFCELVRGESDIPIIIISALDSEQDQIKGYELKIDDYVSKPFSMPILLRKVASVLRRTKCDSASKNRVTYRDLTLIQDEYKVYVNGTSVELTTREFELLLELIIQQGKVLTRQALLNRIWRYDFFGDERIIDTHIKNIRKKIDRDYIETVRGAGYRVDKWN